MVRDIWLAALLILPLTLSATAVYHVDCSAGSDAAPGTSPQAAWRSLAKVSGTAFTPGDSVLLRRGTRCAGPLWPRGSGEEGRPIRIGAYGEGALPVIEAGAAEAAIKLFDQHHWEIENIETTGGSRYGVLVSGSEGAVRRIRIANVVVHDVGGTVETKSSGLVAVLAGPALRLEDVIIDGVTAYNTSQWAGIIVRGGSRENRARNVTVRNSIVHHVYGDGIVLFQVEAGVVEKSAVWLTGLQPVQTIGAPNGIWTWRCRQCTVQLTEGFFTDSPGVDGGVYDIDWGNDANIVQQNYGHDAQGYCAAVFGARNEVTSDSTVRYNVCVSNGRSPKLARRQGDLYISTWDGGTLDGVVIHNNTFYWNPAVDVPAVQMDHADFTGRRPNLFANNVVYSTVPTMIHSSRSLKFERNVYWYTGANRPVWTYGDRRHAGVGEYQGAAGASEAFAAPRLDALLRPLAGSPLIDRAVRLAEMGVRDAFGTAIPQGGEFDIGAVEFTGAAAPVGPGAARRDELPPLGRRRGGWLLLLAGRPSEEARGQVVFLQAALAQYGDHSLEAAFAAEGAPAELANLRWDWNLGGVRLLAGAEAIRKSLDLSGGKPVLRLVSPSGRVIARWRGFVSPAELGLTLRRHLGPRRGAEGIPIKVN